MEMREFHAGLSFDAYTFFGAHPAPGGICFRTWAPGAERVQVIGEWNGWQGEEMTREGADGVFAALCPGARAGMLYKYKICSAAGEVDHCDPYGFAMELRPGGASAVAPAERYAFADGEWMRRRTKCFDAPLSIYEVHLGSWRTRPDGGWYRYEELAEPLIAHAKACGYNYLELMPLSEHPADCSWGYQNTGFYAPTSRYGTPNGLRRLVDRCHAAGIGVLLDFVPVHFALDSYGLARYDGTALYEYPSDDVGKSEWGSCNFMHSRGEVRSFLQSCAHYWLQEFHFDGLRMDAVSRLLYWQGDPARGENRCAAEFLRTMNAGLQRLHPTAILAAEDSTDYPKVTAPVEYGGLGFDYKWDLGWMNDTLDYFKKPADERAQQYNRLTFSMLYFYREHYLLPFSHDESVHGKATIAQKMYGGYEGKFAQARALYVYMMAHPGKKLNFMGGEFAQLREWSEAREQDWPLLKYPVHDAFLRFSQALGAAYRSLDALWDGEYDPQRFAWLDCSGKTPCAYAILRRGAKTQAAAAFNFGDGPLSAYRLAMPCKGALVPVLDTDWQRFGGAKRESAAPVHTSPSGEVSLALSAQSAALFLWQPEKEP